jgi:hypothetical protein
MRRISAVAFLSFIFANLAGGTDQRPPTQSWRPAVYRGLVLGKSSVADVRRVLGEPEQVVRGETSRGPIMVYSAADPIPGRLEVITEGGKLKMLILHSKVSLTQKEVIRLFGADFQTTRYSFDECLNLGGNSPVYEDPDGKIEQMEYRQRGIAISMYQREPQEIQYVRGLFGPTRSRCAQFSKNK